jgi:hypothetical protein
MGQVGNPHPVRARDIEGAMDQVRLAAPSDIARGERASRVLSIASSRRLVTSLRPKPKMLHRRDDTTSANNDTRDGKRGRQTWASIPTAADLERGCNQHKKS